MLDISVGLVKLFGSSKYTRHKIDHLDAGDGRCNGCFEFNVRRILLKVILAVLMVCKLYYEAMGDACLEANSCE